MLITVRISLYSNGINVYDQFAKAIFRRIDVIFFFVSV